MSTVLGGANSFSDGPRVNSGFGESALLLPHAFEAIFTEQQRNYSSAARAAFRRPPRHQLLGRTASLAPFAWFCFGCQPWVEGVLSSSRIRFGAILTEQQCNYSSAACAAFRRPPRYRLLGRSASLAPFAWIWLRHPRVGLLTVDSPGRLGFNVS